MEKKETEYHALGKDKNGMDRVMSGKDFAYDSIGQVSMNTINKMIGNMTYFYTTKIGMNPTIAGNVILISKVFDAITDVIMGRMVDKTYTKDGKARPYLKWMVIPAFFALLLLFTVPRAESKIQFVYAVATNIFAGCIVYTVISIPYYVMINYETKSMEERGKIGTYRGLIGYLTAQVITIVLIPGANFFGGEQSGWIIVAAIFGLVSAFTLAICFKHTKERYGNTHSAEGNENEQNVSIAKAIGILAKNKYWWMMLVSMCAINGIYVFLGGGLAFYCQYIAGDENLTSIVAFVSVIPSLIAFVITPHIIQWTGMRNTGLIGCAIGVFSTVIRVVSPENFVVFIVGYVLLTISTALIVAVIPAMTVNCADWNEYKAGVKLTGLTNSVQSFGGKIGTGIATSAMGYILAKGSFDGNAEIQIKSALDSIISVNIWVPGFLIAAIAICFALYTLEGKYAEIVKENEKRAKISGEN